MKNISLQINGKNVKAEEGMTIIQAAEKAGINIPNLCHDERLKPFGACRFCMVEIEKNNRKKLVASCCYPVEEGLIVNTNTKDVEKIRRILAELVLSLTPSGTHVEIANQLGIKELLTRGSIHANYVWKDRKMCAMYAPDGPSDWIEKNIYTPYNFAGPLVLIFIETLLFGPVGIFLFFLRLAVYWYLSGSVVNGIGHWWGYRNFETRDQSRNFSPVGLIICGEELHNNHHGDAKNPQFSRKWFEFDIAWIYIRIFLALKLASIPSRSSK